MVGRRIAEDNVWTQQDISNKRRRKISKIKKKEPLISSHASSKFWADIVSDDILLEIFFRLPDGRTALQSALVCKHWYSLIYNSQFIDRFICHHNDHHHHQQQHHSLLFQRVSCARRNMYMCYFDSKLGRLVSGKNNFFGERPLSGNVKTLPSGMFVEAVFNDLLLVTDKKYKIYICNPLRRQWMQLPDPPLGGGFGFRARTGYGLVCRANSCNTEVGCSINVEYRYRVVLISSTVMDDPTVEIFCSETGKWRTLDVSFPNQETESFGFHPVVCNGILYWLDGKRSFYGISAFDPFNDEDDGGKRCRYVELPIDVPEDGLLVDKTCFGACLGRVRFAHLRKINTGYFELRVWELSCDDDGIAAWDLVHHVRIERENTKKMVPLAFHPSNGDAIFMSCDDIQFCQYEFKTYKYKELGEWPDQMEIRKWRVSVSSLVHPPWPKSIPTLSSTSDECIA
ncbi:F-box domain containing protein [Trema orientale]|uniref:F-box domain containing protein n=1 Tax=Trema orientale TaxID=63057 RepID=A0A2P5EN08_TREOI|nr:F-box domain containing protein [Trema orientale]